MSRFVLLEHDHPTPHLDLMFEVGEVLWSWRIEKLPDETGVAATKNFDHRLLYLDYEGEISGGRGRVRRIDRGEFVWLLREDECLIVEVNGAKLCGRLELTHIADEAWHVCYRAGQGRIS